MMGHLRYALRTIVRRPGFSATVILVLALGIGGTTAAFAVFYRVLLRPFASSSGDRLMVIGGAASPPQGDRLSWWRQNHTFQNLAVYQAGALLVASSPPERVSAAVVSASFFQVFGISPILGRAFLPEEETTGRHQAAVLSYEFWHRIYAGRPDALGRELLLDHIPYRVIGVAPAGFGFPGRTELWIPQVSKGQGIRLERTALPGLPAVLQGAMVGLLQAGVTPRQAQADLNILFHRLQRTYAREPVNFGDGIRVRPLKELLVHDARPAVLVLLGAVLFLLLTACANGAGMLLARAASREREIAVRLALGATALDVTGQFLAEALLIALAAGAAGLCVAWWATAGIRNAGPADVPGLREVGIQPATLLFCFAVSLSSAVFLSVAPALAMARRNLAQMLNHPGSHAAGLIGQTARRFFVAAQIALAVVLTCGAGLMARSFLHLLRVDPGFDPRHVALVSLEFSRLEAARPTDSSGGSKDASVAARQPSFSRDSELTRQLLVNAGRLPGGLGAGLAADLPLSGSDPGRLYFDLPNTPTPAGQAACFAVGGGYFTALGIPVLSGRPFQEGDTAAGSKVAIVNRTFARLFLHGSDPAGQYLRLEGEQGGREIVGMVQDVRFARVAEGSEPQIYLPYFQPFADQRLPANFTVIVRTAGDPAQALPALRALLTLVDRDLVSFNPTTMEDVVAGSRSSQRFRTVLLGAFAVFALGLGLTGVYAVTAYSVSLRIREIGVRLAIGATPAMIRRMVLVEGARLGMVAVPLGLALAVWVSRFLSGLLFGVAPTDFRTYLLAALVILGSVIAGCAFPAVRASKIDPAVALRQG
jgi:putative ABC transport system permease protein